MESPIKDTLNKGHLCIKDTFQGTNLYSGNTFLPLKEDNRSIMDKMIRPNVSRYLEVPPYMGKGKRYCVPGSCDMSWG